MRSHKKQWIIGAALLVIPYWLFGIYRKVFCRKLLKEVNRLDKTISQMKREIESRGRDNTEITRERDDLLRRIAEAVAIGIKQSKLEKKNNQLRETIDLIAQNATYCKDEDVKVMILGHCKKISKTEEGEIP